MFRDDDAEFSQLLQGSRIVVEQWLLTQEQHPEMVGQMTLDTIHALTAFLIHVGDTVAGDRLAAVAEGSMPDAGTGKAFVGDKIQDHLKKSMKHVQAAMRLFPRQ